MKVVRPTLLIGVGNRDRGDDAAGPIVCDLVADPAHIRTVVLESSVIDLSTNWQADDRVVVVDAGRPADHPGRIVEYDGLTDRFAVPASLSTHAIDVSGAIELARVLGRLPAALRIVAIEGRLFEFGAPLTAEVQRSVEEVASRFARPEPSPTGDSRRAGRS